MFKNLYPDTYLDSSYVVDYQDLYIQGYRGIIYDIDNTLVPHGAPADERAKALFVKLRDLGFRVCLLSNNQKPRVEMFRDGVVTEEEKDRYPDGKGGVVCYLENAHKPSVSGYRKAMALMGTDINSTIFIGDQIFTDVWGANRAGLRTILVKPIHPKEEIQIVLKRYLERIVLHFYQRSRNGKEPA